MRVKVRVRARARVRVRVRVRAEQVDDLCGGGGGGGGPRDEADVKGTNGTSGRVQHGVAVPTVSEAACAEGHLM